jgi:hypothetical protein
MDSRGFTLPDAAVVGAGRDILEEKGRLNDGRQESEGYGQEELAEGTGEDREEEVARSSPALAEAVLGDSG